MPGFIVDDAGAGVSNVVETRRKHRWMFRVLEQMQKMLIYLQKASRPSFTFEEAVMHHDQEQAYFAGKQSWEPIEMTWYDTESPDGSLAMYKWVLGGGLGVSDGKAVCVSVPRNYKKTAELAMTNGCGETTEIWKLYGSWPQKVNWEDLDYTNTEIATISCTLRYDRAERKDTSRGA